MPSSGHQVLSTPLCLGPDTNWLGLPPVRSSDDQHGQSRELPTNELRERLSGLLSLNASLLGAGTVLYYGVAAYLTNDSFNRGAMIMTSLIGAFNLAVNFYGRNQHDATWVKRKVAAVFVHSSQFAFVLALFGAIAPRSLCVDEAAQSGYSCSTAFARGAGGAVSLAFPTVIQLPVEMIGLMSAAGHCGIASIRIWSKIGEPGHSVWVSAVPIVLETALQWFSCLVVVTLYQDPALGSYAADILQLREIRAFAFLTGRIAASVSYVRKLLVRPEVVFNPVVVVGACIACAFFDAVARPHLVPIYETAYNMVAVIVIITLSHVLQEASSWSPLGLVVARLRESEQRQQWLMNRMQVLREASPQVDAPGTLSAAAASLRRLCCAGGGAVAIVSTPGAHAPDAASSETRVHVDCADSAMRDALLALFDAPSPAAARNSSSNLSGGGSGVFPKRSVGSLDKFAGKFRGSSSRGTGDSSGAECSLSYLRRLSKRGQLRTVTSEAERDGLAAFTDWQQAATLGMDPQCKFRATSTILSVPWDETIFCVVLQPQTGAYVDTGDFLTDVVSLLAGHRERQMQQEAEEKVKLETGKRQRGFLALMSHELRTPLNAIIALACLALEESNLDPEVSDHLRGIQSASSQLVGIITQILEFAKFSGEMGGVAKVELNLEVFELNVMLSELLDIVGPKASAAGVEVIADVAERHFFSARLLGDAFRLRQCCINLVDNAIKFTPPGGEVVVRVSSPPEHEVQAMLAARAAAAANAAAAAAAAASCRHGSCGSGGAATDAGNQEMVPAAAGGEAALHNSPGNPFFSGLGKVLWVRICISDTGVGMSRAALDALFVPFSQVSKNSSKKNVGTGLGLCITKALLERMNGILTVTSEEGKGTTFTFDVPFPVDEVEERDEEVESSSSSEPGSFWIPTAAPPEAAAAAAAEEKRSAPDPDTEEESSAPLPALRVALCLHSAALRAAIDRVLSADDGFTVVQVAPEPILAFEPAGGAQAAAGGSGAAEEEAQPAAADYACGRRRKGRRNSLYQSGPIPLSPSLQALHALAHLSSATDSEEGEASSAPSDPPLAPPESPSAPPVAPAPAPTDQASAFVAAIDAACPGSDTCVIVVDCTVLIALLRQSLVLPRRFAVVPVGYHKDREDLRAEGFVEVPLLERHFLFKPMKLGPGSHLSSRLIAAANDAASFDGQEEEEQSLSTGGECASSNSQSGSNPVTASSESASMSSHSGPTYSVATVISRSASSPTAASVVAKAAAAPSPLPMPELSELSILLVEDNVVNQKIALAILKKHIGSSAIAVASDGVEAVEQAKKRHFDCILMDVQMPRMCGLEATGIIRNMEREAAAAAAAAAAADPRKRVGVFPPAAIIGLTANASQEDESDCLNAGMDSFLSKPVKPDALRKAIVDTVQRVNPQRRPSRDFASAPLAQLAAASKSGSRRAGSMDMPSRTKETCADASAGAEEDTKRSRSMETGGCGIASNRLGVGA